MTTELRPTVPARRGLLQTLLALPVLAAFSPTRPGASQKLTGTADDLIEIDGWILKRSDLP